MINSKIFSLLIFLSLTMFGCTGYADQIVSGTKFSYRIPSLYVERVGAEWFQEKPFDKSKSLSISFESERFIYFNEIESSTISIKIFNDREYDHLSSIKAKAEQVVGDAEKVSCSNWVSCYRRDLAGLTTNYYFTFDPEVEGSALIGADDYILSVLPAQSPIKGIRTKGVDVCSYYRVLDGVLLNVSASGELCDVDKVDVLVSGVASVFDQWKITFKD